MDVSPKIAVYILSALCILGGLKGLLTCKIEFGDGFEAPAFRLDGRAAQLAGIAAIAAGVGVLFNLILGLCLIVLTSVLAAILRD